MRPAYRRRHVVPPGPSSSTMPFASNSARMRSASAKFFSFLAVARTEISSSMPAIVIVGTAQKLLRVLLQQVQASCPARAADPPAAADLPRLISPARSNSAANAIGVLKSSFIASWKRCACGSSQSTGSSSGVGVAQRRVQAAQRRARFDDQRLGKGNLAAVVRAQQKKPQHLGVVLLQRVANRQHVAKRLRHLLVTDAQCTAVHPDVGERHSERAFALRDLVLVVRKDQIRAAAVDIERLASVSHAMAEHSMCQPGRPAPQLRWPLTARQAWRASTARSRADRACCARSRRALRRASRRATCPTAFRSRETCAPQS